MGAAASANDSLTQKQTLLNFEHDGFSASFSKIDVDGSGEIDKAEFSEAAKELGVIADPAEIDALFLKCVSQMPHTNNESIHIYAHRTVSALVAPTRVACFHRPTNECLPRGSRRAIASSSSRSRRGAAVPSIALVRSLALSSSCSTPCRAHTRASQIRLGQQRHDQQRRVPAVRARDGREGEPLCRDAGRHVDDHAAARPAGVGLGLQARDGSARRQPRRGQ